jgi:hypothetical protein
MPKLSLTFSANGKTNDWTDVETPLVQIRTLLNTTGLDYENVQANGLRAANLRAHAGVQAGRIKIRNASGGDLGANDLVYPTGTYSDGTDSYPTVEKAVSTNSPATTKYGAFIIDANVNNGQDGTALLCKEVGALDTSGLTVGQPVLLSHTAGGYVTALASLPAADYAVQVVGVVSRVDATAGRIVFGNWSIIPWSIADQCVV